MSGGMRLKGLVFILLLAVLLLSSNLSICNARRGKHWSRKSAYRRASAAAKATLFKKKSPPSSSSSSSKGGSGTTKIKGKYTKAKPPPSMGSNTHAPPPAHYSYSPSPSPSPSPSHSHYSPLPSPSPSSSHSHYPPTPTPSPSSKKATTFKPPPTSKGGKTSPSLIYPPPPPSKSKAPAPVREDSADAVFNVLDFGAKGNGNSDDTKAFQAAWAAACKVEGSTVLVPAEYSFLVGPISFSGPYCQPNIVFQLEGTIVAPTGSKAWGSGLLQWLEFTKLRGITIQGAGVIEGKGSVWWSNSQFDDLPISNELTTIMPHIKPTALRFYGSYNVTVTGITIQNSPQCHLKFDSCVGVEAYNITVSSPADSLNTDGIHLQNSKDVSVHHNQIACGDDCVSIQTGCANVNINHLTCGPGHGISIGGLGRDNTKACVSNITVQNVYLQGTMTGVRIKTWQGGSGSVQNVRFFNIKVDEVQTPIVIDQFYCDRASCRNQSAAVAVQGVSYQNVRGTFTVKPVHFACSDSMPCSDITLDQIELQPVQERYHMYDPFCWQAYGQLRSPTLPPIPIQVGKPERNQVMSDPDTCVL